MRNIKYIKAEIAIYKKELSMLWGEDDRIFGEAKIEKEEKIEKLTSELRAALTADIPLDRLELLCNAEREGRCVVLPCKVGDMVYEIDPPCPANGVIEGQVNSIQYFNGAMFHYKGNPICKATTIDVEVVGGHGVGSTYSFDIGDFGKTVFLTRAEAEAALEVQG